MLRPDGELTNPPRHSASRLQLERSLATAPDTLMYTSFACAAVPRERQLTRRCNPTLPSAMDSVVDASRSSTQQPGDGALQTVVEVSGIRFSWANAAPPVVDIETLRIARGERVFLRGPSGSGKSTLLSLLAGVVTPQAGTVRVLGRDLGALGGAERDRFRADHIGFIFQMFNLIPYLSVVENVSLPCGFSRRRRERAGGNVEAEAMRLLEHLDMGGADVVGRAVTELSVGQQQRVAAARALIGAPELVIADEPTSSLDADRRAAFIDLLFRECARGEAALIFVSHDASLAPAFDRSIEFTELNRA
jgi:putative ABC transport system ATP-binding protein